MGRMKEIKKLTLYQVIDAFPEECKTILPREIRIMRKILKPYLDHLECIREDYPDDFERWYLSEVIKLFIDRKFITHYEDSLKLKRLYKDRQKNPERDELDIARAKDVPIESLYDFGKQRGTRYRVYCICPFHSEKTGSFVIFKEKNRYHCFGCGVDGDSIDFIMKLNNLTFVEAVKHLGGTQ